jgi:hypothetical protein
VANRLCVGHHQKSEFDTKLFVCSLVRGYRIDGAFLPNAVGPAVDLRQSEEMVSLVEVSDEAADFPKGIRFVLVNNRVLSTGERCALCGGFIKKGYVRDSQTDAIDLLRHAMLRGGRTYSSVHWQKNRGRKVS